jgi:hypothetical protein
LSYWWQQAVILLLVSDVSARPCRKEAVSTVSFFRPFDNSRRSASGTRGAEADDARSRLRFGPEVYVFRLDQATISLGYPNRRNSTIPRSANHAGASSCHAARPFHLRPPVKASCMELEGSRHLALLYQLRSGLGHGEKNSRRTYLVCIASISGIPMCSRAGPGRANSGGNSAPRPNPPFCDPQRGAGRPLRDGRQSRRKARAPIA